MITCPDKNLPEWLELEQLVPDLVYTIWDLNNGNGIDKAPNGAESILFKSLLKHYNGDRNTAIQAKAKVYSSEFREWFGDWVNDDKTNVSKVVDENGEPLVVYHGTQTKFTEFSKEKRGTYTGATSAKLAFFAASDKLNSGAYAKLEDLTTAIDKLKKAQTFDINLKLEDIGAVDDISDLDIIGQEYFDTITGIQGSYYSLANDYAIYLNSKGESKNIEQTLTINQAEEWVTNKDLNDYKNDGFIITPEQQEAYKRRESIEIVKSTTTPLDGYDVFKRFKENNEFTKAHKEEINRYFNDIKEVDKKHEQSYKEFIASKAETTPYILPLFLNIKNPKIDDDKGKEYRAISYAKRISYALQEGKDGGVIKNTKDPFDTDVYYFFEPNQIKSIDNIGAFSTTDDNIYYQKGNIDFYRGMLEKRKELESSFEADNKLSDRMLQELEDNGLLTYQEDEELFVNEGMRKYLEDKQEMLSNELYHHLRALYPEVELNFVEGLETAPDAKGMYFLPTNTIDIVLPLATMDTIPHEYAHHYIRMFINTAIVLAAIKEWGSEEALVQAIGEQAVKQEGKAWGWWNQFISWLKGKFDINTKEDKERLKNLLTDAFLTRKNLNEVSYKANLDLKLRTQSVFFQNTESNILKPGDIVFGHPAIGKTYSLELGKYKDKIIDWDVEFNPKRDKWIEEHSNTKKGTVEYKKARNEYLIYPEKYPDYVEFVTTEWNRVKQKARTENKILFASPHNLLKMFPLDFNRIINIEDEDFIKRNVNRGGGEKESRLWKEGINNTISNITNIPIDLLTKDQYFEDYLDKHLGISEKTDEKSGFFQNIDKLSKVYEKIITGLRGRLTSLNRRSTLKDLNTLNELSNVIDLLATLEAKDGVIAFIDHVNDTIKTSKLFLSKKTSDINSKLLIQLKRDYLGFYTPMVKSLKDILDTTELLNDIPEAEEFKSTVDNLLLTLETLNNKYNLILETKTKEFVIKYATDAGSPFVNDLVEWLDNPSNDISFLGYFVGLSSSTNNEMIRIMENIIRNQKNVTDMETLYEGKNIIALLNEAKKSYGSDIMSALLEFSKGGKRTGYFVRDRNYGMFHDALSKELERLALKYNLEKGSDGKYILPEDTVELRRYTKDLNEWYSKHADRRYVPEYYKQKNRILSLATIEAQSNILKRINLILNVITRDGIAREDLLTDSQLDELDRLYAERKNLSNLYNFDGSRKTGEDLDIALELREFNELVNENVKYKTDYAKFNKARDLMIEKYGEDSPEFKKWVSRNVVLVYTDEFWLLLDKLQAPTFATKEDLELHDELVGRRRELHKLYRKRNSLEIDVTKLNEDEILMLKELDIKIANLRQYVKVDDDSVTFNDVAKIVNTKEYYAVYRQKQQEALTKNDPKIFQDWYEANHYEDRRGKMHPVSVWTYLQPVNDTHITYQPSSKWSEPDLNNSSWVNLDYETNSEEAILPKKALYDNSDAFNKIKNNKEAFALYNALIDSMDRSLSKLSFLTHSNKYRLPQMTARTMLMVGRESNIFKGLGYMVKDEFTIKDDDKDYVPTFDRRPDGSLIKLIPTKYLKPLDNPSMISADTVGSVIEFFNMAENYKQMSKVKDDLEMLLDRMSQLEYNKDNKFKAAGTLNVFKKAESLLDMHLYGKRKNQVEATILGKKINITKALSKIYGIAGTINLAFNMWAMATNAITGKGYTVMESTLGRYFNKQDFAWAEKNYYNSLPKIMANLGNPNDTTKLMFMCQLNQVARSNAETFSNLDLSPVLRAINQHFWYNGYTAGDFAVKSTILGAVYHSYRLVTTPDGSKQFMTREDYVSKYYVDAPLTGRVKFDEFDVTLYDVYELDKNTYKVKDEYRQYVTVNLTNMVKNKIQTIAARIDGNINDTDRAAIHANAYALFLVMHRNFMIVGLQDRFKKTQFNYNTGVVEEGIYRSIPKLFNGAFSDGGLNVIHNMIQNYHNMQDYEQYAVRKVITELGTILGVSLLVSLLLVPLADDTDDDWALEALTYIAMRTAFEFRTLYQPLELTALLNSPSAAFSSITNAAEMLKLIWIPNYFSDNSSPFKEISTGAYKGMPKLLRNFIKVTPFKNVIEASDPKAKRKYLDNQLAF